MIENGYTPGVSGLEQAAQSARGKQMRKHDFSARSILMATASSVACAISIAGAAHAAPESSAPAAIPGPTQVGEIVVTAQKRAQSINKVGMAITALTGDQLRLQHITDVAGLVKADPSIFVADGAWGGPIYQIRGVSYNDFSLAASPAVSVYTDEVPYAYPSMSKGAPFDLERVEVLKGPQGTLYGQNSTGGAVNYIAAKPTNILQAGIEATYARFNAVNLNGFVSGPLTETLKARLAFDVDEGGAWQKSYTRDDTLGNKDNQFGRLLLDWTPTDKLKVSANLNGWLDHSQAQAGQLEGIFMSKPAEAAFVPLEANAPVAPHNAQAAGWIPGTHPANDESYYQLSVRAEYKLSSDLLLTYLGSYEHYNQSDLQEPGGADYSLYQRQIGAIYSDSQEVRLGEKLFNDKILWLLGGNYTKTVANELQEEHFDGDSVAFAYLGLEGLYGFPPAGILGSNNVSTDNSVGKSVFGNLEFHPIEQLNFHAGARYTDTDIRHGGCSEAIGVVGANATTAYEAFINKVPYGPLAPGAVVPVVPGGCSTLTASLQPGYYNQNLDENNISWRVGVDWTPLEKTLIYVSVSKGYKAGNFPTLAAGSYQAEGPVRQESVLAYEAGVKTRFWDRRLEVDGDVFYYDYRNKQVEMREPFPVTGLLNTLVNIPYSKETGAELAVIYRPISSLDISLHGTYLDSAVTKTYMGYNPFSAVAINLKGEPFPSTPKWSLSSDAQYNWNINDRYSGFVGADARYISASQGEFGGYQALTAGYVNTPNPLNAPEPAVQPGSLSTIDAAYALLDLRAGVVSRDHHWMVELFGNNVTNTYYSTNTRLTGDSVSRFAGMPATYGVTVRYNY